MSRHRRACKFMKITSYFLGALNKMESLKIDLHSILTFPIAFMCHLPTYTAHGRISLRKKLNCFSSSYLTCLLKHFSTCFQLLQLTHRKMKNPNFAFLFLKFLLKNSYLSMALLEQHHAGFTPEIEFPIFVNDRAYVSEPPMEAERRKIWHHFAFIPYVLAGKMRVLWVPYPNILGNPNCFKISSLSIMGMNL